MIIQSGKIKLINEINELDERIIFINSNYEINNLLSSKIICNSCSLGMIMEGRLSTGCILRGKVTLVQIGPKPGVRDTKDGEGGEEEGEKETVPLYLS